MLKLLCPNFLRFCPNFWEIKTFRGALLPCTSSSYTITIMGNNWCEIMGKQVLEYSYGKQQVVWMEKYTDCLVTVKNNFMSTIAINVQKVLKTIDAGIKHINHLQTAGNSQPYCLNCILLWSCHAQCHAQCHVHLYWKLNEVNKESTLTQNHPLSYPVGYGEGAWKTSASLPLHGQIPLPTHHQSYYTHK